MSIPVHDLGWMAGVFDTRAAIIRKKNQMRKTPQLVLMVETRFQPIIRELSSMTGTQAEAMRERMLADFMRKGCGIHCPEKHNHVYRNRSGDELKLPRIGRWTITGAGMAVVVHNVEPFLRVKYNLLVDAMNEAILNTPLTGQGSGAVCASLRRLKEMGWEIPDSLNKDEIWE